MEPQRQDTIQRTLALRARLEKVPLGEFTYRELRALIKLTGLGYGSAGPIEMYDSDFDLIEERLRIIEKESELM